MVADKKRRTPQRKSSAPDGASGAGRKRRSPAPSPSPEERDTFIFEMKVHELQLEEQNQRLLESIAELDELRARYTELYDFAPLAYLTLDTRARIKEANLTAAAFMGVERGDLLRTSLSSFVAPEYRGRFRQHLQRGMTTRGDVIADELSLTVGGQRELAVQIVSAPLLDERNQVTGFRTAITDVSALKQSQARLSLIVEASRLLASSASSSAEALQQVVRLVVPSQADLCLVDVADDQRAPQRLAVAVADPEKRRLGDFNLWRAPPAGPNSAQSRVLASCRPMVIAECTPERLTHEEHDPLVILCRPTSLMYVPLVARDHPMGVLTLLATGDRPRFCADDLAAAQDLAFRIAASIDQRRLLDRLTHALGDRDDLLAFVSHDLRNPLMGMLLSAENLMASAPPVERRGGTKNLERIVDGIQQMRRMVDDLLDVASVDAGHFVARLSEHNVHGVLTEALELSRPTAARKKVSINLRPTWPDLHVSCDRQRVLQVLSNLIGNAVKFTPENGQIDVFASLADDQNQVVIAVQDTGPGIPAVHLPHVFQRFWQADAAAHKGRGLGLFIAKGIVEAQGGTIWVESQIDQGTTFFFTLPLATAPARDTPRTAGDTAQRASDPPVRARSAPDRNDQAAMTRPQ